MKNELDDVTNRDFVLDDSLLNIGPVSSFRDVFPLLCLDIVTVGVSSAVLASGEIYHSTSSWPRKDLEIPSNRSTWPHIRSTPQMRLDAARKASSDMHVIDLESECE